MTISSIELKDFRNYESLIISLDKKTNILYGKNAQGKTNLLEAAYLSSTTKSHRATRDFEMIRIGKEEAHIRTVVEKDEEKIVIDIHLKKNKTKGIAINSVPLKKAGDIFGILNVVFFSPEDLDIVNRGPAERRKFLDIEICQIDKIYLNNLTVYKKILNQRNRLLKDLYGRKDLEDTLSSWDEKLVEYGTKIIKRRREFTEELSVITSKNYKRIAETEELEIKYEPNVSEEYFEREIFLNRERDIRQGQTETGPHRDDMGFFIAEKDVRKYGSQGQKKSCALSLKMSEIEIIEKKTGQKPVLLLDDVMSELDSDRQREILKSLYDVQTIITCTGIDEMIEKGFSEKKVFIVKDASISEIL